MKFLILIGGIVIVGLCITGIMYLINNVQLKRNNEKNGEDKYGR